MRRLSDRLFTALIYLLAALSFVALIFVIYFITREALPLFREVSPAEFLFGTRWMPIGYTGEPSFGIFNFIAATIGVSLLAILIALFFSIGAAAFLCCSVEERTRQGIYSVIDLLAGIPSVVYGFIGIVVLLKIFFRAGVHTGSCVLAAGILLGGGASNLAERLRWGSVRDYVRFPKVPGPLGRYVYNLADGAVALGAAVLLAKRQRREQ